MTMEGMEGEGLDSKGRAGTGVELREKVSSYCIPSPLFPCSTHHPAAKLEELRETVASSCGRLIEVNTAFDAAELKTFEEVTDEGGGEGGDAGEGRSGRLLRR